MGRRLALDGDLLLSDYKNSGATHALLQELENTFLLRREANTFGGYNYEISHDTLIDTIQKAKKARQEAEVKARQKRLRRRSVIMVGAALGVAASAVIFGAWALAQRDADGQAKKEAEQLLQG